MNPDEVLGMFGPLFPRTTYADTGERWEAGELVSVRQRQAADPARREAWKTWRQHDRRILSLMNRVRAAPILGAGRKARILAELDASRPLRNSNGLRR